MRLGKIKCAAKVGRLMGGFAALFILRRESQTALPKIALSVGFCLAVRVALSDRVADNVLRIDVGGLSKLPVSTRTNVYIKIQMFLFPRQPAYVYLLL